jgi:hypothetical protein
LRAVVLSGSVSDASAEKFEPTRPYIVPFSIFNRLIWPSKGRGALQRELTACLLYQAGVALATGT